MTRRAIGVAAACVLIASASFAQQGPNRDQVVSPWRIAPRSGSPAEGYPRDPLPTFSIAREPRHRPTWPQIGLPLPEHGLRPDSPESNRELHDRGRPHWGRSPRGWSSVVVVPYFVAPFGASQFPVYGPVVAAQPETPRTGRLAVDVDPSNAQVFVDGYYIGLVEDFRSALGGAELEAGAHRVDLVAPGYESISVDVKITAGQTVSFRQALKHLASAPAPIPTPPPAPAPVLKSQPETFYYIPGCYMGNIPPRDVRLPAGCDLSRTTTWRP